MKKEERVMKGLTGIGEEQAGANIKPKVNQSEYGLSAHTHPSHITYSDSGSAQPSKPILNVGGKLEGWIGMFGDHFLCEAGCKKFADKSLDKVIKFLEKEIRYWFDAKEKVAKIRKGKSGVEVKSYTRKPRKKKEDKEIIKHFEQSATDVRITDEVEKGKVLFVKDENIKLKE